MSNILDEWKEKGVLLESEHDVIQFRSALEYMDKINFAGIKCIADIGAGPGHQAFALSKMGMDVTCVDFVKPVYDLPWCAPQEAKAEAYDAIWSHHCLEHIADPVGALINWRQHLKKGGRFFLTVPEIGLTMSSGHINGYSIPLLMYHLAIAGFDCSQKCITKVRSHLRITSVKSEKYHPEKDGRVTELRKLASFGLFPPSTTIAIQATGRYEAKDLHLDWYGESLSPNLNSMEAYDFVVNNLWKK